MIRNKSTNELVCSLYKVLEVEKQIKQYLLENLEDIKVWGSLTRYHTLNKSFSADLLIELQKKNFPNIELVDFEKVEGI